MKRFLLTLLLALSLAVPAVAQQKNIAIPQFQQTINPIAPTPAPATIAGGGNWNSGLMVAGGYTGINVGATLSQTGTITITRYLDPAGAVLAANPSSFTLVASTAGFLSVNDGVQFSYFRVVIANTSGSTGNLTNEAVILGWGSGSSTGNISGSVTIAGPNPLPTAPTATAAGVLAITSTLNNLAVTPPLATVPWAGTALGCLQLTSLGSATGWSVPAGATLVSFAVQGGAVRMRDDGVNPTTTVGLPFPIGGPVPWTYALSTQKFIQVSAAATIDGCFYK